MLEKQFVSIEVVKGGHACTSIWVVFALQSHFAVLLLIYQTRGYLDDIQNRHLSKDMYIYIFIYIYIIYINDSKGLIQDNFSFGLYVINITRSNTCSYVVIYDTKFDSRISV